MAHAPPSEPLGTRDIDSTPPARTRSSQPEATFWAAMLTASRPEAQKRLSWTPDTVSGRPALIAAVLAMSAPWSPTGDTQPSTTSSIRVGSSFSLRMSISCMSPTTRSTGLVVWREPLLLPLPRGVRIASNTKASVAAIFTPVSVPERGTLAEIITAAFFLLACADDGHAVENGRRRAQTGARPCHPPPAARRGRRGAARARLRGPDAPGGRAPRRRFARGAAGLLPAPGEARRPGRPPPRGARARGAPGAPLRGPARARARAGGPRRPVRAVQRPALRRRRRAVAGRARRRGAAQGHRRRGAQHLACDAGHGGGHRGRRPSRHARR